MTLSLFNPVLWPCVLSLGLECIYIHVQSDDQHKAIINSNTVTTVERRSHVELTNKRERGNGRDVFHVKPMPSDDHTKASILLYKDGEHYNAIVPLEKQYDQKCLQDTNHIKGVFLNTYAGTNISYNYDGNAWCNHRKNATNFSQNRNEMTHPESNLSHLSWSLEFFGVHIGPSLLQPLMLGKQCCKWPVSWNRQMLPWWTKIFSTETSQKFDLRAFEYQQLEE